MAPSEKIKDICCCFQLSDEQVTEYMKRFLEDIYLGLAKATHPKAIVKCFVTYVTDLPTGEECGKFLALDLGGTNFRVLVVEIGKRHYNMLSRVYAVPSKIMTGTGSVLFSHIAECLYSFVKENKMDMESLPLGFTFSFPLHQTGLSVGILERWSKGFNASGVVGKDVVQLLTDAIRKKPGLNVKVCAVLNDTTGTLMSCAWRNRYCKIGLIIGTGTNCCYLEKTENAQMYDGDRSKPYVIINVESGAFGDDGRLDFIRTPYDKAVDRDSINTGKQLHEKMISGMYMGELVRLLIVEATSNNILLGGKGSDKLFSKGEFLTKYVSDIESESLNWLQKARTIMNSLGCPHVSDQDCEDIRYICEKVSTRAAVLVSASMATLLNKMNVPKVTIGVDGSLFRFHPNFKKIMTEKIKQFVKPGIEFDLVLSEDGSGMGAALVAAVACKS